MRVHVRVATKPEKKTTTRNVVIIERFFFLSYRRCKPITILTESMKNGKRIFPNSMLTVGTDQLIVYVVSNSMRTNVFFFGFISVCYVPKIKDFCAGWKANRFEFSHIFHLVPYQFVAVFFFLFICYPFTLLQIAAVAVARRCIFLDSHNCVRWFLPIFVFSFS